MAATEPETGGRLPQPTEEVHLPDPSYLPVVVALGVTIIVVGVVLHWAIVAIGAIVMGIALFRWIGEARREMRELPLEH